MSRRDFSDLEDEIRSTVKNAFNYIDIDLENLKKDIEDKAENTINDVKENLLNKTQRLNEKMRDKIEEKNKFYRRMERAERRVERAEQRIERRFERRAVRNYVDRKPSGSVAGVLYIVFGAIGSVTLGTQAIAYTVFMSLYNKFLIANLVSMGFLLAILMLSLGMMFRGISLRKRVGRFKKYVASLDGNTYCSIEKISRSVGQNYKFVVKDLKKMIAIGMFPEAHIDDENKFFMLSDEVYENYLATQEAFKKRKEEELKQKEKVEQEVNDPEKKELRYVVETGNNYIKQIKEAKESIHEVEIGLKLDRLYSIVGQILSFIEKNPKKLSSVNKFIKHYLPITLKLVNAYKELNEQPVEGENIRNAKKEINNTIDTINTAFEKLLDDLFEDVAMDISTDISVLETLFSQEGLTKKDFEK
jgi:5-bromo-4-chloroindolyl phosphate hydrolysis protein